MTPRHFCEECQKYRFVEVLWVKFYTKSPVIETCFVCPECNTTQTEKDFVRKEKTIQLVIPFPTPTK